MLRALHIARALPGRTVKLVYSREQDIQHDGYRPPVLSRFKARLDAQSKILAWHNAIAAPSVSQATLGRATDCGIVVHPDSVTTQIESAIVLGLSAAW